MYLKTYAKFTFRIKFQGHVSDENFFITVCTYLVKFLAAVSEIYKTKDSILYIVKVFNFFRYVPQNIHGHFQ